MNDENAIEQDDDKKPDCKWCENYLTSECTYKDEIEKRHVCHKFGWKS